MQLIPKPQRNNQFSGLPNDEPPIKASIFQVTQSLENSDRLNEPFYERVVMFVDGSNLFYAALNLCIEIDYAKLLRYLVRDRKLVRAYFYTGVDRTNDKQQGFLMWMSRNGYRVISKDLIQMPDGSRKANLDVEIAVDMLALVGSYDTAILISGDGDLAYAANAVAYKGVQVEVVSLHSMTSDSLLHVADLYTDLDAIKHDIAKS